ncbi:hypothetical protein INR49_006870, partial [Caranx melampygus]
NTGSRTALGSGQGDGRPPGTDPPGDVHRNVVQSKFRHVDSSPDVLTLGHLSCSQGRRIQRKQKKPMSQRPRPHEAPHS